MRCCARLYFVRACRWRSTSRVAEFLAGPIELARGAADARACVTSAGELAKKAPSAKERRAAKAAEEKAAKAAEREAAKKRKADEKAAAKEATKRQKNQVCYTLCYSMCYSTCHSECLCVICLFTLAGAGGAQRLRETAGADH